MIEKELYSMQTVADVLSVSKRTIKSWQTNGKLLATTSKSGVAYYSKESLKDFEQFQEIFESCWDKEHSEKTNQSYTLVELFAGGGGLAIGLKKAGFDSLMVSDFDKNCCQTLKHNNPEWNVVEDSVENLDFSEFKGKVDLLTGGFPCQPFSYAGNQLGFEDLRGTAFFEFARAVKEMQPKVALIENVKGLASSDDGKTLETILEVLESEGYSIVENHIYKAMLYKVPQKRERLIIIAVRNDLKNKLIYKRPSVYGDILNVADALKKGGLYDSDVPISKGQEYPEKKKSILRHVPQGGNWKDLPENLQKEYMMKAYYLGGGRTGVARRLSWLEPSLTLTCSPSQKLTERCHPEHTRPLTIREYARIQTFPDDWIFCGSVSAQYKQIGNAVPPNLAEAIGRSIIRMLK